MLAPNDRPQRSTAHADEARRAVAALLEAKQAGDDAAATRHARQLRRALDRHIKALRARERRLP